LEIHTCRLVIVVEEGDSSVLLESNSRLLHHSASLADDCSFVVLDDQVLTQTIGLRASLYFEVILEFLMLFLFLVLLLYFTLLSSELDYWRLLWRRRVLLRRRRGECWEGQIVE
jgi:hypothetical protein